jgi:hypothetical protein
MYERVIVEKEQMEMEREGKGEEGPPERVGRMMQWY